MCVCVFVCVCVREYVCSIHKKIQELNLEGHTKITTLPLSVGKLQSLQKITLNRCIRLAEFPPSFVRLRALKELVMRDCSVWYYSFQLKQTHAALTKLPPAFLRLKSILVLDMSGCDGLDTLPDSAGDLSLLQDLQLAGCALQELPASLSRLHELRVLNLRHCSRLTALPLSIGNLVGLRALDVQGCHSLRELPPSFALLRGLRTLYLHAAFLELPLVIKSLTGLLMLRLPDLGKEGGEAKGWGGAGGGHTILPEWIGELKSLQTLDLHGCSQITTLPKSIGKLSNLETLDLSSCSSLSALPKDIGHLRNLHTLKLDPLLEGHMLGNLLEPTWRYRATVPGLPEVVAGARRMKLPPDSSEPDFPQRGGLLEEDEKKKEAEEECAAEEEAMAAEKEEGEQGEQGEQVRRLVHAEKVALADSVQLIAARERFCKSKELEGQSSTVSQGDNCKRINNASKREQVSRLQGAQDKVATTNTRTRRASKNTLPCVEQVHEEPRLNYVADDQHARLELPLVDTGAVRERQRVITKARAQQARLSLPFARALARRSHKDVCAVKISGVESGKGDMVRIWICQYIYVSINAKN